MNIFIYSDESGVFDKKHNDYFVFGGIILLSKEQKQIEERKYANAEKNIRKSENIDFDCEVKANTISNEAKAKLYRSLNKVEKFGVCIYQRDVDDSITAHKKSKQRFLDWAYKMAVKRKLEALIASGDIIPDEVENLYFFVDEHSTATDGCYELKQTLEQEFKFGVHTNNYTVFHPPILPRLKRVELKFCNSKNQTLVRAADIVANRLYYLLNKDKLNELRDNFSCISVPGLRIIN